MVTPWIVMQPMAPRSRLSEKSAIIILYDSMASDVHCGCRLSIVAGVQPRCGSQSSGRAPTVRRGACGLRLGTPEER